MEVERPLSPLDAGAARGTQVVGGDKPAEPVTTAEKAYPAEGVPVHGSPSAGDAGLQGSSSDVESDVEFPPPKIYRRQNAADAISVCDAINVSSCASGKNLPEARVILSPLPPHSCRGRGEGAKPRQRRRGLEKVRLVRPPRGRLSSARENRGKYRPSGACSIAAPSALGMQRDGAQVRPHRAPWTGNRRGGRRRPLVPGRGVHTGG